MSEHIPECLCSGCRHRGLLAVLSGIAAKLEFIINKENQIMSTVDQLVAESAQFRADVKAAFARLTANPAITPAQQAAIDAEVTALGLDDAAAKAIDQPATPPTP